MPLEEIRDRFTKSERVMIAWRSQEQYWQMKKKMGDRPRGRKRATEPGKKGKEVRIKGQRIQYNDSMVDSMPDKFFNEEGELDMRLMTGQQAVAYMNAKSKEMGLPLFPVVGGFGRGRFGLETESE